MTAINHAATFRQLHQHGLLLLANAWDAGSARLIESLGAKAIATTSAGVAWANGYADGSHLPMQQSIATIANIVRVIRVPLSVDFEDGYASDPATVADNVARVIDAGAVGINIEDGADSPDLLASKIERIKRMAAQRGVDLFVNARTDVYLRGLASDERRVEETLARAARYRAAGADNLFVPGVVDADDIRRIVENAGLPLNVMSRPGLPGVPELAALGVRRLSAGASISIATLDCVAGLTSSFLHHGEGNPVPGKALDYGAINRLFDGIEARQQ
ncbi:PEP phosphonomutase [Rhodanobacter sp. Root480]|jgi:2-methylisocitrate lyase-like PEP mutase family enzyme|uniref:isocitrate lyase/PEP mutase family protein n=1 Tax=Rhodanobacter sp. Root480 TaxID=1736542 RepID=UPI0006FD99B6|nr:isocitrate lyase/phosphoenolpyruvate mutase family protein [Rhodanobacter sp. Root480]KQX99383.1 PEP phosphonomutase [Rhodanobacter sp. Root480]